MSQKKKPLSYFDWMLSFRKKESTSSSKEKEDSERKFTNVERNALGIKEDEFKEFIEAWREKNKI